MSIRTKGLPQLKAKKLRWQAKKKRQRLDARYFVVFHLPVYSFSEQRRKKAQDERRLAEGRRPA